MDSSIPIDQLDDRPIAIRRKRRASATFHQSLTSKTPYQQQQPDAVLTTPKKPSQKRVRFSEPAAGSTGLTPHIKRTSLLTEPSSSGHRTPKSPRRRASMPLLATSSDAAASSPMEFRFMPLRQVLDERIKRRLGRNNMSGEINDIEAERRREMRREREMHELREELARARQLAHGTMDGGHDAATERMTELEQEITRLKEEASERLTMEEIHLAASPDILPGSANEAIQIDQTTTAHEAIPIDEAIAIHEDLDHDLPTLPTSTASTYTSSAQQTSLTTQQLSTLQAHLAEQTTVLTSARLALEHLFPGESPLPLTPTSPIATAKPLLTVLLERLGLLKSQLASSTATLAATCAQESNLRSQFHGSLGQLADLRAAHNDLAIAHTNLTTAHTSLNTSHSNLAADHTAMQAEMATLTQTLDERDRSITRLTTALDAYRADVTSLERLITTLEADHTTALQRLSTTHDDAIADLEVALVADASARRDADAAHALHLKERAVQEHELRAALAEKQALLRALEADAATAAHAHAHDAGALNARVASLAADLDAARADIATLVRERQALARRVAEERDAGVRAVEAVRGEMMRGVEGAEGVLRGLAERSESGDAATTAAAAWRGLLTPGIEGGRFRDVEGLGIGAGDGQREGLHGKVCVQRGAGRARKGRLTRGLDSGIGMGIEEEEEEEGEVEEQAEGRKDEMVVKVWVDQDAEI